MLIDDQRARRRPVRLEEIVTLQRLWIDGQLWRTLSSTNPIESMIGICRRTSHNVKSWQNGDMRLRWTAAGMLEAQRQFRKIIGYKHLARLAVAVEADIAEQRIAITVPTTPARATRGPWRALWVILVAGTTARLAGHARSVVQGEGRRNRDGFRPPRRLTIVGVLEWRPTMAGQDG